MDFDRNVHGGVKNPDFLDFSISVNPIKPLWINKILNDLNDIFRYTYVQWIEDEFQKIFGKSVIVAGATEAFHIIGYHLLNNKCVIIPRPNYSEYFKIAKFSSKKIISPWYFTNNDLDLNILQKEINNVKKNCKNIVLLLGNPNNPTGIYKDLEEFIKCNQDIEIIIDEAFIDFVNSSKEYTFENIVIVRTFTKFFGIPGIRVGYVKTSKYFETFKKYRMEWAIGGIGYTFLNSLIKNANTLNDFKNKTIQFIESQKKLFKEFLYTNSKVNYFLVNVGNIDEFIKFCNSRKIHVRDARSFGVNLVRIGLKDENSNLKLLKILKEWRGKHGLYSRLYR